ncbi:MAG TPA: hypothetical protein VGW75_05185 [Solirubrobacteraceae bacterium]|jgi:hypothetical protein|nr:hypothetical protein [Solirubrobacteraceae bacterium]
MRRSRLALLLAVAVAVLGAAPAQAAPRTQAAADFADAALHAKVALKAQAGEYRRRERALRVELCMRAIRALPAGYERRARRAVGVFVVGILRPFIDVLVPVVRQLVADLDAVPTRDRALIGGRAAWRQSLAALERFPAIDRPCERLDEWRASGWDPAKAPPDMTAAIDAMPDDSRATAAWLEVAARRLRQLGVSPAAARRFTGARFADALGGPPALLR